MSDRDPSAPAGVTFEGTGVRQVRATAVGRGTHGVPDVRRMVEAQFHIAFPHRVWVSGEVGAPFSADDGLRFALHPSTGDDVFSLPCLVPDEGLQAVRDLLARSHDADLEDVVREGRLARVGGLLRYDAARGAVTFLVSELDPTPTAMELSDARTSALRAVAEADWADEQRRRSLGVAPLEVALVGAAGDPALEQVQEQLAQSRFDVGVRPRHVVLTGPDAGPSLAAAVRTAADGADVVLAVRREGRPLGLASYDALEVAQAVALAPVPVVTALGGDGTRTAADQVAWESLPTAAAAVGWLLGRLGEAEHRLVRLGDEVAHAVDEAGLRCRRALDTARDDVGSAVEDAAVRSADVRRRRRLQLRVVCAVLAVAVVVAALVLSAPLLLLALAVPVVALVGVELWWGAPTRRKRMSQRDEDFTQVLTRLHAVRDELTTTTSPERVAVLRELSAELVEDGERLLGVHLGGAAPADVGAAAAGPRAAAPRSPAPGVAPAAAPGATAEPATPAEAPASDAPAASAGRSAAAEPAAPADADHPAGDAVDPAVAGGEDAPPSKRKRPAKAARPDGG